MLWCAYDFALKSMGDGVSFQQCCAMACVAVKLTGFRTGNVKSIIKWNREFRDNNFFRHLNQFAATGIKPEPHLFRLLSFASTHLSKFSIEKVKNYFTATLFPDLLTEFNK